VVVLSLAYLKDALATIEHNLYAIETGEAFLVAFNCQGKFLLSWDGSRDIDRFTHHVDGDFFKMSHSFGA
jgi:hypothetical protein